MFRKALIAEDHESVNISVRKTLEDLEVINKEFRSYCDDAFALLQIGLKQDAPYDLLITDLSFEEDKNVQHLSGGRELIKAARQLQPGLKVIVFSLEHNISVVDDLFADLDIDGYVRKARYDSEDLKRAIDAVYKNKKYRSADLRHNKRVENSYDFQTFDIEIISMLCAGKSQKDIPEFLKQKNIRPSGLSSVEKRLSIIKIALNISSNEQLIAYCKDRKII